MTMGEVKQLEHKPTIRTPHKMPKLPLRLLDSSRTPQMGMLQLQLLERESSNQLTPKRDIRTQGKHNPAIKRTNGCTTAWKRGLGESDRHREESPIRLPNHLLDPLLRAQPRREDGSRSKPLTKLDYFSLGHNRLPWNCKSNPLLRLLGKEKNRVCTHSLLLHLYRRLLV